MCSRDTDYVVHEHLTESKRKSRNLSEKKRRDAFNTLVTDLAFLVTGVERRLDKSNVLKQTITFLKKHNQLQAECVSSEEIDQRRPAFLTADEYFRLLLDSLQAFVFVVDIGNDGDAATICYVGDNVGVERGSTTMAENLKGKSLYDFLDADYESAVRETFLGKASESSGVSRAAETATSTGYLRFKCDFGNGSNDDGRSDGQFSVTARFKILEASGLSVCICLAKPTRRNAFKSNLISAPSVTLEFSTRINVEWKFIQVEPNVTQILGYQPMEMLGTSVYDYCHEDDLDKLVESHEKLKTHTDGVTAPYRFRTKSNCYTWIRTRFYMTYHEWNSKPEFIVCTSVLINGGSSESRTNVETGTSRPTVNWNPPVSDRKTQEAQSDTQGHQQNRKIFRPQPGVCIEHTPISKTSISNLQPPTKKSKVSNTESNPFQDETLQAIGQLNERMLWEILEKKQTSLQEKIVEHQLELKRLQEQLFNAVPLLSSSSLPASSTSTTEIEITSPSASSSLSPLISIALPRSSNNWSQHQQPPRIYGNQIWNSNSSVVNADQQRQFFDNSQTRNSFL